MLWIASHHRGVMLGLLRLCCRTTSPCCIARFRICVGFLHKSQESHSVSSIKGKVQSLS